MYGSFPFPFILCKITGFLCYKLLSFSFPLLSISFYMYLFNLKIKQKWARKNIIFMSSNVEIGLWRNIESPLRLAIRPDKCVHPFHWLPNNIDHFQIGCMLQNILFERLKIKENRNKSIDYWLKNWIVKAKNEIVNSKKNNTRKNWREAIIIFQFAEISFEFAVETRDPSLGIL